MAIFYRHFCWIHTHWWIHTLPHWARSRPGGLFDGKHFEFHQWPDGDNVYSDWSDPSLELTESGFENSSVLLTTLERMLSSHPVGDRKFVISACKDTTGELHTWDETDARNADGSANITKLSRFIRASAAIPGIFQTVEIDGDVYSDGSTVMGSNVFSAINRCRSAGYAEENIVMDVVTTASNVQIGRAHV